MSTEQPWLAEVNEEFSIWFWVGTDASFSIREEITFYVRGTQHCQINKIRDFIISWNTLARNFLPITVILLELALRLETHGKLSYSPQSALPSEHGRIPSKFLHYGTMEAMSVSLFSKRLSKSQTLKKKKRDMRGQKDSFICKALKILLGDYESNINLI